MTRARSPQRCILRACLDLASAPVGTLVSEGSEEWKHWDVQQVMRYGGKLVVCRGKLKHL